MRWEEKEALDKIIRTKALEELRKKPEQIILSPKTETFLNPMQKSLNS